jgi:N utilization substance protein B
MAMAHVRRSARIAALQALFENDSSGHDPGSSLDWLAEEDMVPQPALSYAEELIKGVADNRECIDSLIRTHAPSWPIEQLSPVDKNILRVAIFEIIMDNRVPLKAAINEAVELAKIFGGHNSSRFVNGVLGSISQAKANSR